MDKQTPRGIRNNNPMNVRIGNNWWGESEKQTDRQFEQFEKMEFGIRAAFLILRRYIEKYGRNTVRKIVLTWSPENENNTVAYIQAVSNKVGIDPDEPINYEDKETMLKLVDAMIQVECGQPVGMALITKGYDIAIL